MLRKIHCSFYTVVIIHATFIGRKLFKVLSVHEKIIYETKTCFTYMHCEQYYNRWYIHICDALCYFINVNINLQSGIHFRNRHMQRLIGCIKI